MLIIIIIYFLLVKCIRKSVLINISIKIWMAHNRKKLDGSQKYPGDNKVFEELLYLFLSFVIAHPFPIFTSQHSHISTLLTLTVNLL